MTRTQSLLTMVVTVAALASTAAAQPPAPAVDAKDLEVEFALLPAGSFLMGSAQKEFGARIDEAQHLVTITRPFFLATAEVTQRQWRALAGSNPSYLYDCPDCPVEGITWLAAVAFCNAFSAQVGLTPAYVIADTVVIWNRGADGFRLPTEAEWEYACRAGASGPFNTGECLTTDQANFCGYVPMQDCPSGLWREQTVEVRSFPPNAWGLYDMHGNVSELCWDLHAYHPDGPVVDPTGAATGGMRVDKGGSFRDCARDCRSACRELIRPAARQKWIGMRLARSQPRK
jgi:formylglycine-generating enzyme